MKLDCSSVCLIAGIVALQLLGACASRSKETESAAATTVALVTPSASPATAAAPPSPAPLSDDSAQAFEKAKGDGAEESRAPSAAARSTSRAMPKRAAPAGASIDTNRPRGGPPAAPARHSTLKAEVPEDASPAFAEPPELRAAVLEFDQQFERLSASKACDDACRAFDSMRRSAQRICELVVANDPRERCRTARARLDQASKDLSERCAACR